MIIKEKTPIEFITYLIVDENDKPRAIEHDDVPDMGRMVKVPGYYFSASEKFKEYMQMSKDFTSFLKHQPDVNIRELERLAGAKAEPDYYKIGNQSKIKKKEKQTVSEYFYNKQIWKDAYEMMLNDESNEKIFKTIKDKYFSDEIDQSVEDELDSVVSELNEYVTKYEDSKDQETLVKIKNALNRASKLVPKVYVFYSVTGKDAEEFAEKLPEKLKPSLKNISHEYRDLYLLKKYLETRREGVELRSGSVRLYTGGKEYDMLDMSSKIGSEGLRLLQDAGHGGLCDKSDTGADMYKKLKNKVGDSVQSELKKMGLDGVVNYVRHTDTVLKATGGEGQFRQTQSYSSGKSGAKIFTAVDDPGAQADAKSDFFDPGDAGVGPFRGMDDVLLSKYWNSMRKDFLINYKNAVDSDQPKDWEEVETPTKKKFMEYVLSRGVTLGDWNADEVSKIWEKNRQKVLNFIEGMRASEESSEVKKKAAENFIERMYGDSEYVVGNFEIEDLATDWNKLPHRLKNLFAMHVAQVSSESLNEAKSEKFEYTEDDYERIWNKGQGDVFNYFVKNWLEPEGSDVKREDMIKLLKQEARSEATSETEKKQKLDKIKELESQMEHSAKTRDVLKNKLSNTPWDLVEPKYRNEFKEMLFQKMPVDKEIIEREFSDREKREDFFNTYHPNDETFNPETYSEYEDIKDRNDLKSQFVEYLRKKKRADYKGKRERSEKGAYTITDVEDSGKIESLSTDKLERFYETGEELRNDFLNQYYPKVDKNEYDEFEKLTKKMKLDFNDYMRDNFEYRKDPKKGTRSIVPKGKYEDVGDELKDRGSKRQVKSESDRVIVLFDESDFSDVNVLNETMVNMIKGSLLNI